MPTYQYACPSCDERFEVVQSFSDPSLTVHDRCGGPVRKVYGSVGVVFKGSGFYRTDNRTTPKEYADSGAPSSSSGNEGGKDKSKDSSKDSAAASSSSSSTDSAGNSSAGKESSSGSSSSSTSTATAA